MTDINSARAGTDGHAHPENRLARETSPYLLQHRHNPVDWFSWGDEAIAKARAESKPLLVSIGYSACHWCHVMERESFEDPEIAKMMNDGFVCVKVDREERPDVDAIYMEACQAMTGQGGWPLNAFITPDLKPFFVGTYFPPDNRYGRASWSTVLTKIREAWLTDRSSLISQANELHREFSRVSASRRSGAIPGDILQQAAHESARNFDTRYGGFGSAPKFPPDTRLAMLLAAYSDHQSATTLDIVVHTLEGMAYGGMYDQIGGGFARYSVDDRWLIPHFEKMLYNQALLVPVYLDAELLTGRDLFRRIPTETLDWVLRDMTSPDGPFYCALDADSEGEEGKFYVWKPQEIDAILGAEDAALFCDYYGISANGNFEHGTSNPHIDEPPPEFAKRHELSEPVWLARLDLMKLKVRDAREKRISPGLDDKCLTGWNGLMISAFCRGYQVLGEQRWLEAARKAAGFLLERQRTPEGGLLRNFCKGQSSIRGVLEDYSCFIAALIDLYETTFDRGWLQTAVSLAEKMIEGFEDFENGGFFYAPADDKTLVMRTRDDHDGALPAASSVATLDLLRLAVLCGREDFHRVAQRSLEAAGAHVTRVPQAFSSLLLANRFSVGPTPEVVIAPLSASAGAAELTEIAWRTYLPARVLARSEAESNLALCEGKTATQGQDTAYVCFGYTCQAPVHLAADLRTQLDRSRRMSGH